MSSTLDSLRASLSSGSATDISTPVCTCKLRSKVQHAFVICISASGDSQKFRAEPPRITSNVKFNLQFLKRLKERRSGERPSTGYRRKKVEKDPSENAIEGESNDLYENQSSGGFRCDGFRSTRSQGIIPRVQLLREDGCPKVWVVTSDHVQQQCANASGAYVWSCKFLVTAIKEAKKERDQLLHEMTSYSMKGKLLEDNLDPEICQALKNLKKQLLQSEGG